MSEIRVYHSHIEVFPYDEYKSKQICKSLSKWDKTTHQYIPIGYYVQDNILYLPRGINLSLLQSMFNTTPTIMSKCDNFDKMSKPIHMKYEPRDRIQEESIDFLTSEGNFINKKSYAQFSLNLDTGSGKTYCMINAIAKLNMKAIIITHKTRLKEQWIKEIEDKCDINPEKIINITGVNIIKKIMSDEIEGDIYLVNHQTIHRYAMDEKQNRTLEYSEKDKKKIEELTSKYYKTGKEYYMEEIEMIESKYESSSIIYDWTKVRNLFKKLNVGVKVIDEAHKFFENSLYIDYFSNVHRSYYLTATFSRSDPAEIRIFNRAYASLCRFGEETLNYEENRKHIVMVIAYYRSHPTYMDKVHICTGYGFSAYRYIDYELNEENKSMEKVLLKILDKTKDLNGKTLIISPKTSSVDYLATVVREHTDKTVSTIHSKNSKEDNITAITADIISSTNKSLGTGDDIKGLRVLINLEPIGSKPLADQLRGRLREFNKTDDTFLFWVVDTAIDESTEFLQRIMPVMKKKCKQIINLYIDDID